MVLEQVTTIVAMGMGVLTLSHLDKGGRERINIKFSVSIEVLLSKKIKSNETYLWANYTCHQFAVLCF